MGTAKNCLQNNAKVTQHYALGNGGKNIENGDKTKRVSSKRKLKRIFLKTDGSSK